MGFRALAAAMATLVLAAAPLPGVAQQKIEDPLLRENAVERVSPHVYALRGFPNIGFVVGRRGVLVVDTGMGPRNGALVAREARRLASHGQRLYLTTTHFHPEHASGQSGFPAGTTVIRNRVQQEELERSGPRMMGIFSTFSPQIKELLQTASVGKADVLFDREYMLDLGGAHVRLYGFGAAHTRGDEIVYVVEDRLLLPGDVVENRISPNIICDECSPQSWIAVLDQVAPLRPTKVIPDHGEFGDGALIAQERAFLVDLRDRALALKREGKSAEEAGKIIQAELTAKYVGWNGLGNVPASVAKAYAAAP